MNYFIWTVVISILAILLLLVMLISKRNVETLGPALLDKQMNVSDLKTGDILLCRANNASSWRKLFTSSNFTHVAMIYRTDNQIYVVEFRWRLSECIHIIPFDEFYRQWQDVYEVFAIRRLKHKLSSEQLQLLFHNILVIQKWRRRSYLEMAGSLGMVCMDWMYNQVCLQDRSFFHDLNDSYWICTDLIGYLFLRAQVFHSRPVIITPELFATAEIETFSLVEWDPDLYLIRI